MTGHDLRRESECHPVLAHARCCRGPWQWLGVLRASTIDLEDGEVVTCRVPPDPLRSALSIALFPLNKDQLHLDIPVEDVQRGRHMIAANQECSAIRLPCNLNPRHRSL